MKAIILNEAGSVSNFKYVEIPKPEINADEVLVKVSALSINPVDYKTRSSEGGIKRFFEDERPVILGWDLSGTIVEAGENVTDFKLNDEVFGMVNFPGKGKAYAEYVAVPASHLALKPENISHEEAAAGTLALLTAWQALVTNGKIKEGDKVLIHGASGGVGHYATQIAKHFKAHVIGTSSAKNKEFVLQNGADQHIDYTKTDFEKEVADVDLVLNSISDAINNRSIDVVKPGGKIIYILGTIAPEYAEKAKNKNVDLFAILVASSGADMKAVADLMQKGIVKSHVSQVFSFDEIDKAHLQLETGRTVGKIVVKL
ncbi:zinc-binding dehydrogenase [Flavobacterium sp. LC2016-23]|uniref:NADP-dependent oxidoreductase n=1 Tax=Flavobacterium sp. LC2016-23 TaxID=2666330 RepID=UPI0012AEFFC1|nr:NADP-dependent oxidoreductase [Flavobacterium sp. LC2016-23]MRX38327.1 zinc-binding dehydrogenase [Flavobacterium sp. LC2016-23]